MIFVQNKTKMFGEHKGCDNLRSKLRVLHNQNDQILVCPSLDAWSYNAFLRDFYLACETCMALRLSGQIIREDSVLVWAQDLIRVDCFFLHFHTFFSHLHKFSNFQKCSSISIRDYVIRKSFFKFVITFWIT